jgi:hypothetical protein
MPEPRPTAWQYAKKGWRGFRWRDRALINGVVGGALAIVALDIAGLPREALTTVIVVVVSAVGAAILVPLAELGWAFVAAPMRLLTADVIAIRERLEAAPPASAPPPPPNVRLWLLEHVRKGEALLHYHSAPSTKDAEDWAAEASAFLRENCNVADAERFLTRPRGPNTLEQQVTILHEIANEWSEG